MHTTFRTRWRLSYRPAFCFERTLTCCPDCGGPVLHRCTPYSREKDNWGWEMRWGHTHHTSDKRCQILFHRGLRRVCFSAGYYHLLFWQLHESRCWIGAILSERKGDLSHTLALSLSLSIMCLTSTVHNIMFYTLGAEMNEIINLRLCNRRLWGRNSSYLVFQ